MTNAITRDSMGNLTEMRLASGLARGLLTASTCVVVALTAAACGDDAATTGSGPQSVGADAGGADAEASESGYDLPDTWPVDTFPTPPGAEVSDSLGVDDTTASLSISEADPQEMLTFFRETLPAEGYELVSESGNEEGMLSNENGGFQEFSGNGITVGIIADDLTFITLRVA